MSIFHTFFFCLEMCLVFKWVGGGAIVECFLARPVIKDNYSFWGAHKPYWGGPRGQKREWVRLLLRNIIINTIVIIVFNIIINTIVIIVFNTTGISTYRRLRCLFVALRFCLTPVWFSFKTLFEG